MPFSHTDTTNSDLGYSVACSADGSVVAAGAPAANGGQGQVFIFRSAGSFIPNDTIITGTLCVYQRATLNAPLNVAGNIHLNNTIVTGTGLVTPCATVLSDTRTKDKVVSLDPVAALEKLRSLNPVTFFWKDTAHHSPSQQIGFVAQHMRTVFPHWVSNAQPTVHEVPFLDNNTKYIVTIKAELYAYLIAALEQLVQRNTEQKATIVELEQHKNTA